MEQNLIDSKDATGSGGCGLMPMEIGAGFADNAGGAMLAPFVRVCGAPQIKACNLAAAGESSTFDNH